MPDGRERSERSLRNQLLGYFERSEARAGSNKLDGGGDGFIRRVTMPFPVEFPVIQQQTKPFQHRNRDGVLEVGKEGDQVFDGHRGRKMEVQVSELSVEENFKV